MRRPLLILKDPSMSGESEWVIVYTGHWAADLGHLSVPSIRLWFCARR